MSNNLLDLVVVNNSGHTFIMLLLLFVLLPVLCLSSSCVLACFVDTLTVR